MKRNFTLMPHQEAAVEWLLSRDGTGLVYGDPGVGKTFISTEYALRADCKNVLIVCPSTLKMQWRDEIRKYCGELAAIVDGASSEERARGWRSGYRFKITNYEKVMSDLDEIRQVHWDLVVADESHYVNSPVAKRTKAFKAIPAKRRLALSGDPFPNALYEAFSIIDWFQPGFLGKNFYAFKNIWCTPHPAFPGKIVAVREPEKLKRVMSRFIHRIHKEEVLTDLPPKTELFEWVELLEGERAMYEQIKEELRLIFQGKEKLTVTNMLAMFMRLRQIVDDPQVFDILMPSAKAQKLAEILARPTPGKTIVFTEFSTLATRLARQYGGSLISGALSTGERERQLDRFKKDPSVRILFSTAAGGYGLNLTVASRVVHIGVPWNWSRVNQRVARAWRKGQEEAVEEIYLLGKNTVDVRMLKLVESKKELASEFDKAKILKRLLEDDDEE